jgi:hypothetical protein
MIEFKVSTGLIKRTNQLMIDSNKLENVFYNIGNKFKIHPVDMEQVDKILTRNYINIYSLNTTSNR